MAIEVPAAGAASSMGLLVQLASCPLEDADT